MSPSLTTLAAAKAWLGLSSSTDDGVLGDLIASVSQAIAADLGRVILPQDCTDIFDGAASSLPLREWPVTSLGACTVDGSPAPLSSGPGSGGIVLDPADPAPPGRPQFLRMRGGWFAHGLGNVVVSYRAGYEIIDEAAIVPGAAPFTLSASAPFGAWICDTGVSLPGGGAPISYQVVDGLYTFDASLAGSAVALSYAYVPADLARATLEWVADRYASRNRIGQSSKSLGGQETTSFIVKAMPDIVDLLLQPYRRVAV